MESPQVWKFSEEEWHRVPLQIRTPGAQYQARFNLLSRSRLWVQIMRSHDGDSLKNID